MASVQPAKADIQDLAARLWETADELRANSHLKAAEYSIPVLGLIFLKFADSRFTTLEGELKGKATGRREIGKTDYQAKGVLYLPEQARFSQLLRLRESDNLGKAINDAMAAIEDENPQLKGVLPRTYQELSNSTLVSLVRSVNAILGNIEGDAFGKVYEYFLGKFAIAEGAKGGEYFTPTSIVQLIVEIIEPFSGRILDPACGSGGMFVQSARFVEQHRNGAAGRLSIYGQERVDGAFVNSCGKYLPFRNREMSGRGTSVVSWLDAAPAMPRRGKPHRRHCVAAVRQGSPAGIRPTVSGRRRSSRTTVRRPPSPIGLTDDRCRWSGPRPRRYRATR
jgi:hypothetical protein